MARQVVGLRGRLPRLFGAVALVGLIAAGSAHALDKDLKTPQTPWSQLSPQDQQVLAPLAGEWSQLPGYQQQRLRAAAKQYPKLQPIQRERFQERVHEWAAMTPDQRKAARETFQGLQRLPPEKQHELKQRWLKKREEANPPAAPPKPQ